MKSYQIAIIAILFSFLFFIFDDIYFTIIGFSILFLLLWMMKKSLMMKEIKYEPMVFLGLAFLFMIVGIFIFNNLSFSIYNITFFIFSAVFSKKDLSKEQNGSKKEKTLEELLLRVEELSREVKSTSSNVSSKDDIQSIIRKLDHLQKEVGLQMSTTSIKPSNNIVNNHILGEVLGKLESLEAEVNYGREHLSNQVRASEQLLSQKMDHTANENTEAIKGLSKKMDGLHHSTKHLCQQFEIEVEGLREKVASESKGIRKEDMNEAFKLIEIAVKNDIFNATEEMKSNQKMLENDIQSVRSDISYIKETSAASSYAVEKIPKDIINIFKEQHVSFSNDRLLTNNEINDVFRQALDKAEQEICICSPWIGRWLSNNYNEIYRRIDLALNRGVNVRIAYGIKDIKSYHNYTLDNNRDKSSENTIKQLRKDFSHKKGQFLVKKYNTHEKVVICDEKFYMMGSMNVLSNRGEFDKGEMWDETMQYSENPNILFALKKKLFRGENWKP